MKLTAIVVVLLGIFILSCSNSGTTTSKTVTSTNPSIEARLNKEKITREPNALAESNSEPIKPRNNSSSKPPVSTGIIDISDLVEEFNNNAVVSTEKYQGSTISVTGIVAEIDFDIFQDPFVDVEAEGPFNVSALRCKVPNMSDVQNYSVGDKITVKGNFSEWNRFNIVLEACSSNISLPTPTPKPAITVTPYPSSTLYPIPTAPAIPTVAPTPTRPNVSGYLLIINEAYVLPNEVSIPISNGHIMVSPMTNEDGSYPRGTEVTLGYYPDNPAGVASVSYTHLTLPTSDLV